MISSVGDVKLGYVMMLSKVLLVYHVKLCQTIIFSYELLFRVGTFMTQPFTDERFQVFTDCSCVPSTPATNHSDTPGPESGVVTEGSCPADCSIPFYMFLAIVCINKFIGASGRTSNFLVSVRSEEHIWILFRFYKIYRCGKFVIVSLVKL